MTKKRTVTAAALCIAAVVATCAAIAVLNKNNDEKAGNEMEQAKNTENETSRRATENIENIGKKTVAVIVPPEKPEYYEALLEAVKNETGAILREIAWADVSGQLNDAGNDAVIWPEAEFIPAGGRAAVDTYLKNGGKLLTLGGPPFTRVLHRSGEQWLEAAKLMENDADKNALFAFGTASDGKNWNRATDTPKNKQTVETGDFGLPGGDNCLHVQMERVAGWDVISKNVKIPEGADTLCLYVKGGARTSAVSIELDEKDGSRWYSVFPVTEDWQYIVLRADEFKYWHDSPAAGRGGAGDRLDMSRVTRFAIGIGFSGINPGENEYWFGGVSVTEGGISAEETLIIEGVSPEWKFYPVRNGEKAVAFINQVFVSDRNYTLPKSEDSVFSPSPRPQGTGYKRGKDKRFVPLIEIYDEKNLRSGFLAWMFVNSGAVNTAYAYAGSITAGFGTSDPAFYNGGGAAAVAETLKAMLGGVLFAEAGSTEYIYIDAETKSLPLGAFIRGEDTGAETLMLEFELYKEGEIIYKSEYDISKSKAANAKNGVKIYNQGDDYDLSSGKPDKITATLTKNGETADRISHGIVFWSPKPESERRYIRMENNEFVRDKKTQRLYGVNYMPSSGIGVNPESWEYFEQYVSKAAYDPDVFYKDLLRVKEVGFNAVSLFVYHQTVLETKNMLHLIDMCDKLGLIVDLSIRPHADPFDLQESEVAEMIKLLHIAELDNIVAYDIAWERYFGTYEGSYGNPKGRKAYDGQWREWIDKNYGSLSAAEATWGFETVKTDGKAVSPTDDMLRREGAHTEMAAAYRRFADELVAQKHKYVKDLITEYDPNHLVSARTGAQGGLPLADPGDMGYDYKALAEALDFMSPESYVINADLNTADQGIFTNVYSRYCKPGAPVVWKEFGSHIWTGSNFYDTAKAQEIQAEYYAKIYDMAIAGHTGGMFCWWWPGGYRTNENSDYGVINPDGSDRLVTGVIRAYREAFLNQPALKEPDAFFKIDRDKYATGIFGVYGAVKEEFLAAVKSGKTVAFID